MRVLLAVLVLVVPHLYVHARTEALAFVESRGRITGTDGQQRPDVLFVAESAGMRVYLRRTGISYVFLRPADESPQLARGPALPWERTASAANVSGWRLDLEFVGARSDVEVVPEGVIGELHHYSCTSAPDGDSTVPAFRKVTWRGLYPGVDLVIRSDASGLKYDLIVRPGAEPSQICFRYLGATRVTKTPTGGLEVTTPLGVLREGAPVSYQPDDVGGVHPAAPGERVPVATQFVVRDSAVRFAVGRFDRSRALVIDPSIAWATYLGGSAMDNPGWTYWGGRTIATTPGGGLIVIVGTNSTDFPVTPGAFVATLNSTSDITVSKFTAQGAMVWSTYVGTTYGQGQAVAVDSTGAIYVGGQSSSGFATTPGAYQPVNASHLDGFIIKLDSNGRRVWSTYLGGSVDADAVTDLAIAADGDLVVSMPTWSPGLASPGASLDTGIGLVAKFSPNGVRRWATYTGTWPIALACARRTGIYVAGHADVAFRPTPGAWQSTCAGRVDGVLLRFDMTGARVWGTFLGGAAEEFLGGIDVAGDTAVFFTGYTQSTNLPVTARAFQTVSGGAADALLGRIDSSGRLQWLTYLGGTGNDYGKPDVCTDDEGHPFWTGTSASVDFPVTRDALSTTRRGIVDAVIARFTSSGTLLWSTYLGGNLPAPGGTTFGDAIAVRGPAVYISATTYASNMPVTPGAFQPMLRGSSDAFVARICYISPRIRPGALTICPGDTTTLSAPPGFDCIWSTGQRGRSIRVATGGRYWFSAYDEYCIGFSDTVTVVMNAPPAVAIKPGRRVPLCAGAGVTLDAGAFPTVRWSTGDTTRTINVRAPGRYIVSVRNAAGCWGSDTVEIYEAPLPSASITASSPGLCAGDTVVLTGPDSARVYEWSNGRSECAIRITAPGTYSLRVVDSNGCQSPWVSITLREYPAPIVAVSPTVARLCRGDSIVLSAPRGFVAYRWSTGDTTSAIVMRDTGRVRVEVIDSNGCRGRSEWCAVVFHAATPLTIVAPSPPMICDGASLTLTVPQGFSAPRWSTGDSTASITVSRPGRYRLEARDSNGCPQAAELDVAAWPRPVPRLLAGGEAALCVGDSIVLRLAQPYTTVAWSDGTQGPSTTVRAAGTYWASVVDEHGCEGSSDTLTVRLVPAPSLVLDGAASVCTGSTVRYSVPAQPGVAYTWTVVGGDVVTQSGGSIEVRWDTPGAARVAVHARDTASGCAADTLLEVDVASALTPRVSPAGPVLLCRGDSLELVAGAGYERYRWSTGETTRSIVVRSDGSYTVEVTSMGGTCRGTSQAVVVTVVDPVIPSITAVGAELVSTPAFAYQWLLDGAAIPGAVGDRLAPSADGSYRIRTVDSNGCVGISEPHIIGRAATAALTLAEITAVPGEHIELPLRLVTSTNLDALGLRRWELAVRFNKSLLLPRAGTPIGRVSGSDRIVVLEGERPTGTVDGIIGRLEFTAALGDTLWTPVTVERFRWLDGPAENSVASGSVAIATSGGWVRYHARGSVRLEIRPNPFGSGPVDILMELIEPGRTRLAIVDVVGRTVLRLSDAIATPGVYAERRTLSLPSGAYFLVLETPTGRCVCAIVSVGT